MDVIFTGRAKEDLHFWKKNNPKIFTRINRIIEAIIQKPFSGLGKPEPLRFQYTGYWSRRIDHEHRLVYKVVDNILYIAQCRYHY